jgi:hypothetical protein
MKGQIFIIASILVLLALFITRLGTQTVDVRQNELFYESFSNLKNELIKTIDVSLLDQPANLQTNLNDFIDFSNDTFKKRGYIESVNYSVSGTSPYVIYLNVSLSSGNDYLLEKLIINRTVYS